MASQVIKIRLKSYDHRLIDKSAKEIVDTVGGSIPFWPAKQKREIKVDGERCGIR